MMRIIRLWNENNFFAASLVLLCTFIFFVLFFLVSDGDPIIDDHYFHFKYAYLLRVDGWETVKNFDWIYLTGAAENGSRYPVSLYQIALIPFTYFDDHVIGLHVADAFFASITVAVLYVVLRLFKVRYPLFFVFALFSSEFFMTRMQLGRSFFLVSALLLLELYYAMAKKQKVLSCVVFFHVLWHQATYFMPFFVVGVVELARYLVYQKIYWKNVYMTMAATILSFAFFPGFPMNIVNMLKNILAIQSGDVVQGNPLGGIELYKINSADLIMKEELLLVMIILCVTTVVYFYVAQKKGDQMICHVDKKTLFQSYGIFMFVIALLFGSFVVSGRFFDFFIPAIFVLAAILVTIVFWGKNSFDYGDFGKYTMFGVVLFFSLMVGNAYIVISEMAHSFDYKPAMQASQWIREHSNENDKVFLHNWSTFSLMFFNNSYNVYSTGIEPLALKKYDESLYWKYYNIFAHNYYCDNDGDCKDELDKKVRLMKNEEQRAFLERDNSKKIINSIKNDFGAKYIVSTSKSFNQTIALNADMIEDQFYVKSDKYEGAFMEYTVFKLK